MASASTVLHAAENGNGGSKRTPCPLHGCKRVYADATALESHIKDHEIPAQSVPGKILLCSTVGCSGSFPDMQKLMEHMRHHHKPNIFFLCESCRTKLRSYRGLLTHLHTCSKVPRGKPKPADPAGPPQPGANPGADPNPPAPQNPNRDFPDAVPQPDPALLGSAPFLSRPEAPPAEAAPQPPLRNGAPSLPPSLNPDGPSPGPDPSEAQARSPEPVPPAPPSAPHSPPGSSAVWKKNPGVGCSRRILWEHTKGRYTCVQCGHAATNRKEMTQHISSYHSGSSGGKAAEDAGSAPGT